MPCHYSIDIIALQGDIHRAPKCFFDVQGFNFNFTVGHF